MPAEVHFLGRTFAAEDVRREWVVEWAQDLRSRLLLDQPRYKMGQDITPQERRHLTAYVSMTSFHQRRLSCCTV